jgi:hypothetical protein
MSFHIHFVTFLSDYSADPVFLHNLHDEISGANAIWALGRVIKNITTMVRNHAIGVQSEFRDCIFSLQTELPSHQVN